ncbi:MAG: immunoglobulin-like domain-containing protein [Crocinitomicaceae bacterium]
MKNLLLLAAVATIGLASCKKKGCTDPQAVNFNSEAQKDDESCNYIPTIAITGASTLDVELGSTYTDPGATATNKDGSAVNVTTDLSLVNTAAVGSFTVTYTATNEHGTATATRTVNVVVGQNSWLGSPTVTDDCGVTVFPVSGSPTISAGATTSDLIFDPMFTLVGGTMNATIDGSDITVPQQTINITTGDIIFSGSGTMNVNGTQFTIVYNYENTTPLVGGTGSCTVTYSL